MKPTEDASKSLPQKLALTFKTGSWRDVLREYNDIVNASAWVGKYKSYQPLLDEIRAGVAGQGGRYKRTVEPYFDPKAVATQMFAMGNNTNVKSFLADYADTYSCEGAVEELIAVRDGTAVSQRGNMNKKLAELEKAIAIIQPLDETSAAKLIEIGTTLQNAIRLR